MYIPPSTRHPLRPLFCLPSPTPLSHPTSPTCHVFRWVEIWRIPTCTSPTTTRWPRGKMISTADSLPRCKRAPWERGGTALPSRKRCDAARAGASGSYLHAATPRSPPLHTRRPPAPTSNSQITLQACTMGEGRGGTPLPDELRCSTALCPSPYAIAAAPSSPPNTQGISPPTSPK
jgi:hypothetical protein